MLKFALLHPSQMGPPVEGSRAPCPSIFTALTRVFPTTLLAPPQLAPRSFPHLCMPSTWPSGGHSVAHDKSLQAARVGKVGSKLVSAELGSEPNGTKGYSDHAAARMGGARVRWGGIMLSHPPKPTARLRTPAATCSHRAQGWPGGRKGKNGPVVLTCAWRGSAEALCEPRRTAKTGVSGLARPRPCS